MQDLPETAVNQILTSQELLLQLKEKGNIFELARQLELVP